MYHAEHISIFTGSILSCMLIQCLLTGGVLIKRQQDTFICPCNPTNKLRKVKLKLLVTDVITIIGSEPACAIQVGGHLSLSNGCDAYRRVMAVHMEVLAGHGETCRWMSAAAGTLGNWLLDSILFILFYVFNNKSKRALNT